MELEFINHPEGYIEPVANTFKSKKRFRFGIDGGGTTTYSSYNYVFQYKDHLGNVRLSYSVADLNGSIDPSSEIIEESNYYPFGLKQKGYNNIITGGNDLAQKWKYNGIELNEDLSLNLYEMEMRQYDPAIARWTAIDPVTHFSNSTYNGFVNNPVFWADPSGADGEAMDSFDKTEQWGTFYGWNNCASCGSASGGSLGLVDNLGPSVWDLDEYGSTGSGNSEGSGTNSNNSNNSTNNSNIFSNICLDCPDPKTSKEGDVFVSKNGKTYILRFGVWYLETKNEEETKPTVDKNGLAIGIEVDGALIGGFGFGIGVVFDGTGDWAIYTEGHGTIGYGGGLSLIYTELIPNDSERQFIINDFNGRSAGYNIGVTTPIISGGYYYGGSIDPGNTGLENFDISNFGKNENGYIMGTGSFGLQKPKTRFGWGFTHTRGKTKVWN